MTLAFKDTILTNKGFNISNKAALGKTQFSIVKAVSTDYDLTNYKIEDLKNLTSLPNEIDSGTLTDYDAPENSISVIKLNFDNSKFKQGYTVRAIGLYGKDSDGNVFLHSLTVSDTPIVIPEVTGNIFDGLNHSITIFSGDNKKMNVDLEQQGAASIHYVDQSISKISDSIKNDIQPALDGKADKTTLAGVKAQLDEDIDEKASKNDLNKLNDKSVKFIREITNYEDLDTVKDEGQYRISGINNPKNIPLNALNTWNSVYGILEVYHVSNQFNNTLNQKLISFQNKNGNPNIYIRSYLDNNWTDWEQYATEDELVGRFNQLNQNIEDAENRSKQHADDKIKFFNSLNDVTNATAPEGTIAIVKGG